MTDTEQQSLNEPRNISSKNTNEQPSTTLQSATKSKSSPLCSSKKTREAKLSFKKPFKTSFGEPRLKVLSPGAKSRSKSQGLAIASQHSPLFRKMVELRFQAYQSQTNSPTTTSNSSTQNFTIPPPPIFPILNEDINDVYPSLKATSKISPENKPERVPSSKEKIITDSKRRVFSVARPLNLRRRPLTRSRPEPSDTAACDLVQPTHEPISSTLSIIEPPKNGVSNTLSKDVTSIASTSDITEEPKTNPDICISCVDGDTSPFSKFLFEDSETNVASELGTIHPSTKRSADIDSEPHSTIINLGKESSVLRSTRSSSTSLPIPTKKIASLESDDPNFKHKLKRAKKVIDQESVENLDKLTPEILRTVPVFASNESTSLIDVNKKSQMIDCNRISDGSLKGRIHSNIKQHEKSDLDTTAQSQDTCIDPPSLKQPLESCDSDTNISSTGFQSELMPTQLTAHSRSSLSEDKGNSVKHHKISRAANLDTKKRNIAANTRSSGALDASVSTEETISLDEISAPKLMNRDSDEAELCCTQESSQGVANIVPIALTNSSKSSFNGDTLNSELKTKNTSNMTKPELCVNQPSPPKDNSLNTNKRSVSPSCEDSALKQQKTPRFDKSTDSQDCLIATSKLKEYLLNYNSDIHTAYITPSDSQRPCSWFRPEVSIPRETDEQLKLNQFYMKQLGDFVISNLLSVPSLWSLVNMSPYSNDTCPTLASCEKKLWSEGYSYITELFDDLRLSANALLDTGLVLNDRSLINASLTFNEKIQALWRSTKLSQEVPLNSSHLPYPFIPYLTGTPKEKWCHQFPEAKQNAPAKIPWFLALQTIKLESKSFFYIILGTPQNHFIQLLDTVLNFPRNNEDGALKSPIRFGAPYPIVRLGLQAPKHLVISNELVLAIVPGSLFRKPSKAKLNKVLVAFLLQPLGPLTSITHSPQQELPPYNRWARCAIVGFVPIILYPSKESEFLLYGPISETSITSPNQQQLYTAAMTILSTSPTSPLPDSPPPC